MKSLPCIVISPNNSKQSSTQTRLDMEGTIDPKKLGVGINMIRNSKSGSLILKCDSIKSNDRMKIELEKSMGSKYEIKETKLRKPSLIVSNIDAKTKEEDIVDCIKQQNSFLCDEDKVELKVFKKSRKSDKNWAVLECSGSAFRKILLEGKLNLNYQRCPVYENVHVPRCFKCNGFYHRSEECTREVNCAICSENHDTSSCRRENHSRCVNCVISNEKYKFAYDVNHNAMNRQCPVYLRQLKIARERTDYS